MEQLLTRHNLYRWPGLGGIDPQEPKRVRFVGRVFTYLIILAAVALALRREAKEVKREEHEVAEILVEVQTIRDSQRETLDLMKTLNQRLDRLEKSE